MALPTPGASKNNWGNQLNDFLREAHNEDGSLKLDGIALEADLLSLSANVDQVSAGLDDANDAIDLLQNDLEGQVADAIANDETVQTAITTAIATEDIPGQVEDAVDAEIEGRDMIAAEEVVEDDIAIVFTAENGAQTWLGAKKDGGPTPYGVTKIKEHITGAEDMDSDVTGLSFSITDENGVRLDLETGLDGKFSQRVIGSIATRLGIPLPRLPASQALPTPVQLISGPDIVVWGDSLSDSTVPTVLATLTGRIVHGRGKSGEDSMEIAARAGANPLLMLPDGGEIPTSGAVDVSLPDIYGRTPDFGNGLKDTFVSGSFGGVAGTLAKSGSDFTFTRTASGDAVTVTQPLPWLTPDAEARRGDIAVIWASQNNGSAQERAIADTQAIINHLSSLDKRYIVLNRPTSDDAEDEMWYLAFGRRFIAIRRYMFESGLVDAGITPTTQDNLDIAAEIVPDSLRSDSIHFNTTGQALVAQQVNARLLEFGWI